MSDMDQCAAGTPPTELERVRDELDMMKSAGVIEVATRNPSVWDFVQDREARIADLERQLAEARDKALDEAETVARQCLVDLAHRHGATVARRSSTLFTAEVHVTNAIRNLKGTP